jgi:hypothetical protein
MLVTEAAKAAAHFLAAAVQAVIQVTEVTEGNQALLPAWMAQGEVEVEVVIQPHLYSLFITQAVAAGLDFLVKVLMALVVRLPCLLVVVVVVLAVAREDIEALQQLAAAAL